MQIVENVDEVFKTEQRQSKPQNSHLRFRLISASFAILKGFLTLLFVILHLRFEDKTCKEKLIVFQLHMRI